MLQLFLRNRAAALEARATGVVALRLGKIRAADLHVRLQLRGGREQIAHLAHRLGELRLGLVQRHLGIRRIETHERLAGLDELSVVGADRHHGAGDLRRDLHDVAADVGIIRVGGVPQIAIPIDAVGGAEDEETAEDQREPAHPGALPE